MTYCYSLNQCFFPLNFSHGLIQIINSFGLKLVKLYSISSVRTDVLQNKYLWSAYDLITVEE